MRKFLPMLCLGLFLLAMPLSATTQFFVFTPDGVWIASDTLQTHTEGGTSVHRTVCKLVFTSDRIIFNAGGFDDYSSLQKDESKLPLDSLDATEPRLVDLLLKHQNDDSTNEAAGIVQVRNGKFEASMFQFSLSSGWYARPILRETNGLLHGFGELAFQERAKASWTDPTYAAAIAKDPIVELGKVLEAEVRARPQEVGRPFSIVLFRRDGTIEDHSSIPVCKVSDRPQ